MVDFSALITNSNVWHQFPHVLFAGISTAAFFVLGISAYHLYKKSADREVYRRSFQMAVIYALVGAVLVGLVGHSQMQHVGRTQPMKLAAGEAIWESEQPAGLSLLTIGDLSGTREVWSIRLPYLMSLLVCNNLECEVTGMNELQAGFEQEFGPGNYVPPIPIIYWSFRIMFNVGLLMILLALVGLYLLLRNLLERHTWFLRLLPFAIVLPYLANSAGWIMAEVGRQPWIVYGLMLTRDGVSEVASSGMVLFSLLTFTLIYVALMAADVYLLAKYARKGTAGKEEAPELVEAHQVGGGA
jgi:cytochrome d ubiquinol oxidase subunit I